MPSWEKFLKEDEMWDAILFLYDFTAQTTARQGGGREVMTARLHAPPSRRRAGVSLS